jgi:PPM family protein phosphatase
LAWLSSGRDETILRRWTFEVAAPGASREYEEARIVGERLERTPAIVRERTAALHAMLRGAARDRSVAPRDQPFAFRTHHGKVRKDNQDAALILAGRAAGTRTFCAAILCDGMGGLENGADAADLAAATAGGVLAASPQLRPLDRVELAIRAANEAVFSTFRGRAGTVLVAALIESREVVVGWVGDARAYGARRSGDPTPLTRDDTVAAEIARIEGSAPDAMDSLLRAVGQAPRIEPHVALIREEYARLLLVSDGVHRIEPPALSWVNRHSKTSAELVERLVAASFWEGGSDNSTAIALDLTTSPLFHESGQVLAAWVESQPRIWEVMPDSIEHFTTSADRLRAGPANSLRTATDYTEQARDVSQATQDDVATLRQFLGDREAEDNNSPLHWGASKLLNFSEFSGWGEARLDASVGQLAKQGHIDGGALRQNLIGLSRKGRTYLKRHHANSMKPSERAQGTREVRPEQVPLGIEVGGPQKDEP